MIHRFSFFLILLTTWHFGQAQKRHPIQRHPTVNSKEVVSFGGGLGSDYGGIGARVSYSPIANVSLFASGGYALIGAGYNVGAIVRIQSKDSYEKIVPTVSGMYGFNSGIYTADAQYNKLYYGTSIGLGFISKPEKHAGNYWHFELIIPFRPDSYDSDVQNLKNLGVRKTELPSVLFSVGYHFKYK